MKQFVVYNANGKILRTGTCIDSDFLAQAQDGEAVIQGLANDITQCIIDGEIRDAEPVTQNIDEQRRECLELLRTKRNAKITKTDYTQLTDSPLTDEKKVEWAIYRQALRDLPSQYQDETNIDSVVYPTRPEA